RDSIHSVREVLDTGLGSAVQLRINLDDGIWPVMVDPAELETALVNLIINARDAMPDGGSVSVRASNVHIDNGTRKGDHVAIEVKDTGVGIPPDIMGKVFDPFFTTKPIGKGTGLGLSQVHGFAHQAGGTVTVASELGKGTKVTILLPREQSQPKSSARNVMDADSSGTVLLVEDNPEVASVSAG